MHFTTAIPLLAATAALASPVETRNNGGAAQCRNFYADITASANNIDLKSVIGGAPENQQALVQSAIDQYAAGSTVMQRIMSAPSTNVSGTYRMWFEYCAPTNGDPRGVFHTVHGIVGNAGYWNVKVDGDTRYSFAESAAAAGWATLSYDRLGVGRSAHPDGISVVQLPFEVAQAASIAQRLRAGTLGDVGKFDKVVAVGHSYGSNLLVGAASAAPNLFNATILTGFTNNVTMGPLGLAGFASTIASVAYPNRFGGLSNGYVITPSVSNDQMEFFHRPNYTQSALDMFTNNKGEYTLGQQNSIAATIPLSRQAFTRPVLVITGANDAPYCAANCYVTSRSNGTQLDTARGLFPSVSDNNFKTYVVPDTGHGINYHTTAYSAYQQIIQFVQSVGL